MATNIPTIDGLGRMAELIDAIKINNNPIIEELKAWNKLLKSHIGQQKKQQGLWKNDYYTYNNLTKKITRIRDGDE